MDIVQAIGFAILHSITSFVPLDESAHRTLLSYFWGWSPVPDELCGALYLSSLLALIFFYRHDWASIISSGLRSLLTWTKPMMLDERMPLFLILTAIPAVIAWFYAPSLNLEELKNPVVLGILIIATCLPLWFAESMNRRTKSTSYWNWKDSLILGFAQITFLVPGVGRQAGALVAAYLMNYQKEAVVKFTLLSFAPVLALNSIAGMRSLNFHDAVPAHDLTWMSFWSAVTICFLVSMLTLNYITKHAQTNRFSGTIFYRILLGSAVLGMYWFRSRS